MIILNAMIMPLNKWFHQSWESFLWHEIGTDDSGKIGFSCGRKIKIIWQKYNPLKSKK
jgi:hypothetical protein